jgi:hypothetical protein
MLGTGLSTQQPIHHIARYGLQQCREITQLKHGAGSFVYTAMSSACQCLNIQVEENVNSESPELSLSINIQLLPFHIHLTVIRAVVCLS